MTDNQEQLEPAIPAHLVEERTLPLGCPLDFQQPKYALHSARFDRSVKSLTVVYLGLQFLPARILQLRLTQSNPVSPAPSGLSSTIRHATPTARGI